MPKKEKLPHDSKKTKKIIWIAAAVLVVLCLFVAGIFTLVRYIGTQRMVNQQNYLAAKLIETGAYDDGQQMAMDGAQVRKNDTSHALIVLASAFKADYESGLAFADAYLSEKNTEVIAETKTILEDMKTKAASNEGVSGPGDADYERLLDEEVRSALISLLFRVRDSISVKKNAETMQAMLAVLTSGQINAEDMQLLAKDSSPLAAKICTVQQIQGMNYSEAASMAQKSFEANPSFANRAVLANVVATGLSGQGEVIGGEKTQKQLSRYYEEHAELEQKYTEAENAGKSQRHLNALNEKMEQLREKIAALEKQLKTEPAERVINFIKTTTPVTQRAQDEYHLELAHLYFLAGQKLAAEKELLEILDIEPDADQTGLRPGRPVSMLLHQMVHVYENRSKDIYTRDQLLASIWKKAETLLGCILPYDYSYYQDDTLYDLVLSILNRIYRGLVIRDIDTTDYPTVRVTVNLSQETEHTLNEKDFSVTDMKELVSGLRLLDAKELAEISEPQNVSVMLAVDNSGSMQGDLMDHTKSSVISFARELDSKIRLGLTVFDDSAELLVSPGQSRGELMHAIDGVYADGGTSIRLGLDNAANALMHESGRKVIILLSDGVDGDTDGIDRVISEIKAHNIFVYTIAFPGADESYLSYIAESCGGKFIKAASSSLLAEIYNSISRYMVNDYVLEFKAKTDPETFRRYLHVKADTVGCVADSEYNVGVSYEQIDAEQEQKKLYDAYRQIGGSSPDALAE